MIRAGADFPAPALIFLQITPFCFSKSQRERANIFRAGSWGNAMCGTETKRAISIIQNFIQFQKNDFCHPEPQTKNHFLK